MITHLETNGKHYYNVTPEHLANEGIDASIINAALDAEKWKAVREKRDNLIADTDSLYLRHHRELRNGKIADYADNPIMLSSEQLLALDAYVQALADIPQTYNHPDDVVWPVKPTL